VTAVAKDDIVLGALRISLVRKRVKNVHLTVHPPEGRVTLVAPENTRPEVARAYAISKLAWIRQQQATLKAQAREAPRQFRERESHELWGRRHLMTVQEADAKPSVKLDHKRITLTVRPGHDLAKRAEVMHEWHKALLHGLVPQLIAQVGAQAGGAGVRLLFAAHENQVGQLQPPRGSHPAQHRAGQKAQGSGGVRGGA
jgi:predicted metal-dependent hydrolase